MQFPTPKQADQRYHFVYWLTTLFNRKKENVENTIAVYELYDLFKEHYPKTKLTEEEVWNALIYMGYLDIHHPTLRIEPNLQNLALTDTTIVSSFLKLPWDNKTKTALIHLKRTLQRGTIAQQIKDEETQFIESIDLFYCLYCFNMQTFPQRNKIPTELRNAIAKEIFEYYKLFCEHYNYKPAVYNMLRKYLMFKGHKPFKGYCRGKSGVTYYKGLCIPELCDDTVMFLVNRYKIGVLRVDKNLFYDNTGQLLNEKSPEWIDEYVKKRVSIYHEAHQWEEKEERSADGLGLRPPGADTQS